MGITEEQSEILNHFVCERLTYHPENRDLIDGFQSEKGKLLVDYLQKFGWDHDTSGEEAFYLIKEKNGQILAFFSLICGALFENINKDKAKDEALQLEELIKEMGTHKSKKELLEFIEQCRTGQYAIFDEHVQDSFDRGVVARKLLRGIERDEETENNEQIYRVRCIYPGIEIKHFCVNDLARGTWSSYGFEKPMGEVLFWKYIIPIIIDAQKLIGCQYVYLFAADLSKVGSLINYYNVSLKFEQKEDIGTSKPFYDFACTFMCQEINRLKEQQSEYFMHFNDAKTDILA